MKKFFSIIKEKLFTRVEKQHSEAYLRRISFLNKYSLLFHMLISCGIVFMVEVLSLYCICILKLCLSVPQTCILADHYQRFLGAPWNH